MLPVHAGAGILQLCKISDHLLQPDRDILGHCSFSLLEELQIQDEQDTAELRLSAT